MKKNEKNKKSTLIGILIILIILALIIDLVLIIVSNREDQEAIYVKCIQKTSDVEYAYLDVSYSFNYQNKKISDINNIYKFTFKDTAAYNRINEDRLFISMIPKSKIFDAANLVKEYSFDNLIPYNKINSVEDYIKIVEENNYTCTIIKDQKEKPSTSIRLVKNVECYQKNIQNKNYAELNVNYSVIKDYYSFYVSDKNSLIPNNWTIDMRFNTVDNLNTYYDYLINVLQEPEEKYLKDEKNNIITYIEQERLQMGEQNFLTYEQEYKDYLNSIGYSCTEIKIYSDEELYN